MKTIKEAFVITIALIVFGIAYLLLGIWRKQPLENTDDCFL